MTHARRALVAAAVLIAPAVARAEPPASATVRWQAPAGCPDEAALRARVDARLAKPLGAGDAIDATVTVARARRQLHARVHVWTPAVDMDRELVAARCDELADAVAVVLARAVAEARALEQASVVAPDAAFDARDGRLPQPDDRSPPPPRRPAPVEAEPVRRRAALAGPRRDAGARPAIVTGAGLGPHVDVGLELGLWLVWDGFAAEVTATRWLERLAELPASQRFGAAIGLDAVTGRACWSPERFGPRVCALGEVGTMTGRGVGLFDARVGEARYSALGLGVSLRARLRDHVALVAGFDMLSAVDRPRFILDRGTVLHQPDRLSGRVDLGVELGWR